MKTYIFLTVAIAFGLLSVMGVLPDHPVAHAQGTTSQDFVPPIVFQAAGPTVVSIQSSVDAYRAALGANNGTTPPPVPLKGGRREINWDGGNPSNQSTAVAGNPFAVFQVPRGALFTTPDGTGFVQAPPIADAALFPPGGMAGLFKNESYGKIFTAFSNSRLFSAIGGRITDVDFFLPGNSSIAATVTGFGAVFTDVDLVDDSSAEEKSISRKVSSTLIEYFGINGELLFSSLVPAAPGDGSLTFFGIVFTDARIARVRITSGNVAPGPDDGKGQDIVMMDDFIYGEPQALPTPSSK